MNVYMLLYLSWVWQLIKKTCIIHDIIKSIFCYPFNKDCVGKLFWFNDEFNIKYIIEKDYGLTNPLLLYIYNKYLNNIIECIYFYVFSSK